MCVSSPATILTPHKTRLVTAATFESYELLSEVVSIQGLLGSITDGAGEHLEPAATVAR